MSDNQNSQVGLTPESFIASGLCRSFLSQAYHLGVLFLPILGLIEKAARAHPQDWTALLSEAWPLIEARQELADQIRQMERKYQSRRKDFFPAVERLVLARAAELKNSQNYQEKVSDILQSKALPRHLDSAIHDLLELVQGFLPYFEHPEAKPVSEAEMEKAKHALKRVLQKPPGRRRKEMYAEGYKLRQQGKSLQAICMTLDSRYRDLKTTGERSASRKRMAAGIERYARKQATQSK